MSLQDEINDKVGKIFRDSYQMSIGELINLYKDGEMDIHPEFQRVFRWSDYQKTRLIESIMLNIPIPSIFVNQNEDGVWDIIDGVQRLSTIFQFVGICKDENDKLIYDACSMTQAEKLAAGSDKYKEFIQQRAFYKESFIGMQS